MLIYENPIKIVIIIYYITNVILFNLGITAIKYIPTDCFEVESEKLCAIGNFFTDKWERSIEHL